MKNYKTRKEEIVNGFYELLEKSRETIKEISSGRTIEFQRNGVTFSMIDPFSDIELSDVIEIKGGLIILENGTEVDVDDITNLTDLIGLLNCVDE